MSYQPLKYNQNLIRQLKSIPFNPEEIYETLDLHGVERACIDRLSMIIRDTRKSNVTSPTVLDLGCSGGFFSIGLAASIDAHVTGVDDNRYIKIQGEDWLSSIEESEKRAKNLNIESVNFIEAPIEDFLLKRKHYYGFDYVLCLNILHHFYKGYGNLTQEGKLEKHIYLDLVKKIGQLTKEAMYYETNCSFFDNYDESLLEIYHYGGFSSLNMIGGSPAADGEQRILWKFQK